MMSKKLFIGIAPLFAILALALTPSASMATEHYWFNEGAEQTKGVSDLTVSWGDLSLKGAAEINCHNVIAGSGENPLGTASGTGLIYKFGAFQCTSPNITCPTGTGPGVEGQNLPWKTVLEGSPVRLKVTGVKVIIGCEIPPEDHVTGTAFVIGAGQKQTPLAPAGLLKGTGAGNPGKVSYDAGSGSLEAEGSKGTVTGVTEGETKLFGYSEQELVNTK